MKTIGLLGGMSWESSQSYYQALNRGVKEKLGGLHSAKIVLVSVDFAEIETLQHQGNWDKTADILTLAAKQVEAAGADFLLICTNTMHKVAPQIEQALSIPLLHIADATAEALLAENIRTVGLLGTQFTMSQDFYKGRLQSKYGLDVLVPNEQQQQVVHDIIYQELCLGKIKNVSRNQYLEIIHDLSNRGAEGIILGCTEIALLVKQADTPSLLFDTTTIHAEKAVLDALADVELVI